MSIQANKTILLVEDEALIGLAEANTVRSFGYNVITASSGMQAVNTARSNRDISLILMDIDLGRGISGPEAATQILSERSLPIVFLTSHNEREMVQQVRGITRYGYVIKNSGDFVLQSSIEMAFELFEAHEHARQREATLRTVQEMAHIGEWTWDVVKEEVDLSDEMYRMFGLRRETCREGLVNALLTAIYPDDRAIVERTRHGASRDVDPRPVEFRVVWPDGSVHTIWAKGMSREFDDVGRPVLIAGFAQDVSERKQAEAEILAGRKELELALRSSGAGVWRWDIVHQCLQWSDELFTLFGLDPAHDGPTFDNWGRVLHPDDRKEAHDRLDRAIQAATKLDSEYRILRPDGEVRWIQALGDTTYDQSGNPVQMTGICIDITERKQMEDQLLTSRRITEDLINAIPARIFWKDRDLVYLGCNEEFARDAGFTDPRDIVGKDDYAMGWREQAELYRADDRAVIDTGRSKMLIEEPQTTPDGRTITLLTSKIPLRDHRGEIIGVLGVYLDISARKQAEEAVQKRLVALTQPLESGAVTFEELFNPDEIQRIQDEFSQATGVASIITHPDGRPLTTPSNFTDLCSEIIRKTEKGCANCFRSDAVLGRYHPGGPVVQPCLSGGLWDGGASIVVGNTHVANWLIGQVRDETQSEENMRAYAREIGADEAAVIRAFYRVPAMSREKFEQIAKVLFTLAGQLSRTAYQNVQQARFITERRRAEEKIKSLLSEKELLLKEVHHRIKNNMNTMMSILSLQASSLKDPGSVAALAGARRRMQSMMLLYDKLYRSDNVRELSIREYLHGLVRDVVDNFPNRDAVTIRMDVDAFAVDARQLSALGIIINELLANAMKYAFDGRAHGVIRIRASKNGDRATFVVQDDGIGVPEDAGSADSSGFGLRLVDLLTQQLDGTLRIERKEGTRVTLECDV